MKVGNKLLNRIVAVGMLAVVLFCTFSLSKPEIAQAATFSYTVHDWDYNLQKVTDYTRSMNPTGAQNAKMYVATRTDSDATYLFLVAEDNPFGLSYTDIDNGKNLGTKEKTSCDGSTSVNGTTYYYMLFGSSGYHTANSHNSYTWAGASKVYSYDPSVNLSWSDWVYYFVTGKKPNNVFEMDISCNTSDASKWQGGQGNPIEKADFGYPQIYNSTYIHNDPNNLETLDKLYSGQDFQWKKKTTTGFDLTNNDYNYTYIECKVKANYQYNDKFSGKGSWHDFTSYGEMGNLGKVRAESLSHYYTFQEFQEALPKTSNELPDHKMRAIKSSAVYYFRVVCMKTSSTVVIPDEKDCKYYCGPWRSITVTKINGKDGTSIIEDGDMDENGEWKKDDSSNDNGKDIDNGSAEGDDLSDASDKAHETINSNANKSTLDLDSAKAFINQVADVPKMIADIFSFLPDWVKYSFAFGFALIPILIIFKLIRG